MGTNQEHYSSSFLLAFSNEMALATDRLRLAKIIDQRLRAYSSINGFIVTSLDENGVDRMPFFYENEYQRREEREIWVNFSRTFKPLEEIVHRALTNDTPVILREANIEKNEWAKNLRIKEISGNALKLGSKNIGILWLLYDREGAFTNNHCQALKGICLQIAIAFFRTISSEAIINSLANEKIAQQLKEVNNYKQLLEEEKHYLQQEVSGGYSFSEIIGSGPEMKQVYEQMSQVAFANSTVLILGETGTGKELIARGIHNASKRKDKLMVKVNCASIPENLIESELFGHEKGSFTGAIERRIGKFELANNGTLFLDEIGEMPMELQVKLLRAIQEKEIERIGGKAVIKINVRIIAATNRDLLKEVHDGNFRSDLFYRLNVFPITMPPLRNRREDIPLLVAHFINRFARNTGKKVDRISSNAMKDLMSYDWPGNVRELEHLLERSILISKTEVIREVHLPNAFNKHVKPDPEETYVKTIIENERDHILFVLKKCNGKIYGRGGAAELLDMHVSTLNSRIKKLGIKKEHIFVIHPQM